MIDPIDTELRRIAMAHAPRCQKELDDSFGAGALVLLAIGLGVLVVCVMMGWL